MTTTIRRTPRWRRSLAAAAALTLPLGVAACGDDGNDDPDVVNEEQVDDEVEDELDDAEKQLDDAGEEIEEQSDELQEELDDEPSDDPSDDGS